MSNTPLAEAFDPNNLTTQKKRLFDLYLSGRGSDVTFFFGKKNEQKQLKAHKAILQAASPVFDKMFQNSPIQNEFQILENDPKHFDCFLKFLYTESLFDGIDCVIPLLSLATEYNVPDLAQICGKLLETGLSEETALSLFKQAVQFKECGLEKSAIQFIAKRAHKFIETPEFLELEIKHLTKLLELDSLAVKSEMQILEFCVHWAQEDLKQKGERNFSNMKYCRSALEKLIPLIRFPQMTPCEFSLVMIKYAELLTFEEAQLVFCYHNIPKSQWSTLPKRTFNSAQRDYYLSKHSTIVTRLNTRVQNYMEISNKWHRIAFKCDSNVMLDSIGVNERNQDYQSNESTVEVRLEDETMENIFASKKEILQVAYPASVQHVKFDKPVQILAQTWYTASLRIEGQYYAHAYINSNRTLLDNVCLKGGDGEDMKFEFKEAKATPDTEHQTTLSSGQMAQFGFLLY